MTWHAELCSRMIRWSSFGAPMSAAGSAIAMQRSPTTSSPFYSRRIGGDIWSQSLDVTSAQLLSALTFQVSLRVQRTYLIIGKSIKCCNASLMNPVNLIDFPYFGDRITVVQWINQYCNNLCCFKSFYAKMFKLLSFQRSFQRYLLYVVFL